MTTQEAYRKGFVDGRKFLIQYATEDGWPAMLVNVAKGATETWPEDCKEFDPPKEKTFEDSLEELRTFNSVLKWKGGLKQ